MRKDSKELCKKIETIMEIILLVWFVGSMALIIYCGETGKSKLIPVLFGQLFFLFGLVFLRKKDKGVLIVLAHYTTGLVIVVGFLIYIAYPTFTDLSIRDYITLGIAALSILIGYILLIVHKFIKDNKKEKNIYYTAVFLSIFGILMLVLFDKSSLKMILDQLTNPNIFIG